MTDDLVYDALTSDIYGQGKVLALSKYKFLRWSYSSFLYGMVAAITVFLLQGTIGDVIYDFLSWIGGIFVEEMIFTLDGFRELLCQGSAVCRNGG